MPSSKSSSAAASMAGYLIQVHRAIYHLTRSGVGDYVGIEALDDIVILSKEGLETWEQDKLTLSSGGAPLTNRSKHLWRTLDIWTDAWSSRGLNEEKAAFLLVTNRVIKGASLKLLAKHDRNAEDNASILSHLKEQYQALNPGETNEVQTLINNVLSKGDALLKQVITCIRLQAGPGELDGSLVERTQDRLPFAGIGIDDGVAYQSLVGWIHDILLKKWWDGREGWISTEDFNRHCYRVTESLKRKAVLPRAARLIPVTDEDYKNVRKFRFVSHLGMIDVDGSDLDEEMAHYVRFIRERIRLTELGEVLKEDWDARGDSLKQQWKIMRREHCINCDGEPKSKVGLRILLSAYKIREPVAGSYTLEIYMTMGHFHRLADQDRIAWHPDFKCQE